MRKSVRVAVSKRERKERKKSLPAHDFLCLGTFAVVSMMVGNVVEKLTPDANFIVNGTNGPCMSVCCKHATMFVGRHLLKLHPLVLL